LGFRRCRLAYEELSAVQVTGDDALALELLVDEGLSLAIFRYLTFASTLPVVLAGRIARLLSPAFNGNGVLSCLGLR